MAKLNKKLNNIVQLWFKTGKMLVLRDDIPHEVLCVKLVYLHDVLHNRLVENLITGVGIFENIENDDFDLEKNLKKYKENLVVGGS